MALFQSIVAVVLTIALPLTKACTGRYDKFPQPWFPTPINTCLYLCPAPQQETFSDALDECLGDNATLTTINSQRELQSVIANGRATIWIGLRDEDGDGNFEWIDGSDDGFISWAPGFPQTSGPSKACVVVTSAGMKNVDCDEKHNFLCERGLCQEYGGTCLSRKRHCCKEKLIDDISECSGDSGMICCKSNRAGPAGTGDKPTPPPVTCTPGHQDCLCEIRSKYIMYGSTTTPFTPAFHINNGCENGSPLLREPPCGEPQEVCLRHRILNLLKCYHHTCDEELTITDLVDDSAYPDNSDFCNGRCVRIVRPEACPEAPLKQMCEDVGGSYSEQIDANNEIYVTCCY